MISYTISYDEKRAIKLILLLGLDVWKIPYIQKGCHPTRGESIHFPLVWQIFRQANQSLPKETRNLEVQGRGSATLLVIFFRTDFFSTG